MWHALTAQTLRIHRRTHHQSPRHPQYCSQKEKENQHIIAKPRIGTPDNQLLDKLFGKLNMCGRAVDGEYRVCLIGPRCKLRGLDDSAAFLLQLLEAAVTAADNQADIHLRYAHVALAQP